MYTVTPYLWHIELLLVIAVSEDALLLLYSVQCMYTVTPYLWHIKLLLVIAVSEDALLGRQILLSHLHLLVAGCRYHLRLFFVFVREGPFFCRLCPKGS